MRSIFWKLLLAFVVISLGGTALFFLVARQYSNQEIRDYILVKDQSRIAAWLVDQYEITGTLENLGKDRPASEFVPKKDEPDMGDGNNFEPSSPYYVVNIDMVVVQGPPGESGDFKIGDVLSEKDLKDAYEITLEDGEVIGWLFGLESNRSLSNWGHPILERLNELLLISAVGAMLLAMLLALVFSRSLSRPLQELSEAAQVAATGDLSKKVEVKSKDELGLLANSFNQMMEDLEKMITSRRQMTADIAHELRTPISVILGYTEAVHEDVLPPDKKTFEIVHDEALRLERLVKDLRMISQADVGELPLELQRVSVEYILEQVEKTAIGLTIDKEIEFKILQPDELPELMADPIRIIQVLRNVVENGVRYTPQGGKIMLAVEMVYNAWVRFSILDEGPGVSVEDLPRLFERFYQVDASRTRNSGGSGLGLAIARSIVEQHHGKIWAENGPEKGLKIIFDLPVD